jgi:hypothetical protein
MKINKIWRRSSNIIATERLFQMSRINHRTQKHNSMLSWVPPMHPCHSSSLCSNPVNTFCQHELFVKDILHVKFLKLEIGVIKFSDMNIFFRKIKDKKMNRDCKSTHGYNKRIKQLIKVSTTEYGPITFWNAQTTHNKNECSLVLITASSLTNYSYACNCYFLPSQTLCWLLQAYYNIRLLKKQNSKLYINKEKWTNE